MCICILCDQSKLLVNILNSISILEEYTIKFADFTKRNKEAIQTLNSIKIHR